MTDNLNRISLNSVVAKSRINLVGSKRLLSVFIRSIKFTVGQFYEPSLSLYNNQIKVISLEIGHPTNLTTFRLDDNELHAEDIEEYKELD